MSDKIKIQHLISEIKNQTRINEVVNNLGGLGLVPTGNSLQGNCPTGHSSINGKCFSVNLEQNYYHCFSCGAGGDVISLAQIVTGLTFKETLKWFVEEFNIHTDVDFESIEIQEDVKRIAIYKNAVFYEDIYRYGKELLTTEVGQECTEYLINHRGLTPEIIKNTEWIYFAEEYKIKNHLKQKYPEAETQIDNLRLQGFTGDTLRLATPYRNKEGIITGFLKRSTSKEGVSLQIRGEVKHNIRWDSTPGLTKNDLYGIYNCKGADTIGIVEGYPDVNHFQALGINNIVAVGQALLSEKHLDSLKEIGIKKVIFAFDNDHVGTENTAKAVELIHSKTQITPFVIDPKKLGDSKDPDEYVLNNGLGAFNKLMNNAEHSAKWLVKYKLTQFDLTNDISRQDAIDTVLELESKFQDRISRELYLKTFAEVLDLSPDTVEAVLKKYVERRERKLIEKHYNSMSSKINELAKNNKLEDVAKLVEEEGSKLKNRLYKTKIKPTLSLGECLQQKYDTESQREEGLLGYKMNKFSKMGELLDGIQNSMILIGGTTNSGKTALMTNMYLDLIESNPELKGLYISLDDPRERIIDRLLGIESGIDLNKLQRKQDTEEEQKKLKKCYDDLIDLYNQDRMDIRDATELNSLDTLEAIIRDNVDRPFFIAIDGVFNLEVGEENSIREENIKRANKIKMLVDTYKIPVICTGELRKKANTQSEKSAPKLDDFMESGKYVYNANLVLLVSPGNIESSKTLSVYELNLDYAKNKVSSHKGNQALVFEKNKGDIKESHDSWA